MSSLLDPLNQMVGILRESLRRITSEPMLYSCVFAVLFALILIWRGPEVGPYQLLVFVLLYILGLLVSVLLGPDVKDPHSRHGEATDLFEKATSMCRWLGIAGTPTFRNDIKSPEPSERRLLSLLTRSSVLPVSYKFLFANPYCRSFETRLKDEGKGPLDLQRVRNEVIELATALANTIDATHGAKNSLWVGFHSAPLIWNMIAVDKTVYVGRYVPGQPGHVRPLTRIRPSSEENDDFRTYYQHLVAQAFPLRGDLPSDELQRELVRAARMRDDPQCCPSIGLRKSNIVLPFSDKAQVAKVFALPDGVFSEAIGLSVLQENFNSGIPQIVEDDITNRIIRRRYVVGPRLYDVFVALREIESDQTQQDIANKACGVRKSLLRRNQEWLSRYQCEEIQESLRSAFSDKVRRVYQFHKKAAESIEVIREYLPLDCIYWCEVRKLMDHVCDRLREDSRVFLRDANPKNVIVCEPQMANPDEINGFLMNILRDSDNHDGLAENLWKRCYQIDFESVSLRSTPYDDYILLYTSPSVSDPEEIRRWITCMHDEAEDNNLFEYTLLFRSLRSLARRIYYKYEDPIGYTTRYGSESLDHFALIAEETARRLTSSMQDRQKLPIGEFLAFARALVELLT